MIPEMYTHIEDYLLGHLSEREARQVEQRAQSDADFARELLLQKFILEGIEAVGDAHIQAEIAQIDHRLEKEGFFDAASGHQQGAWFSVPLYRTLAIIAAVLLAALAIRWWLARTTPAATREAPAANTAPAPQPGPAVSPDTVATMLPSPTPPGAERQTPAGPDARYPALAMANWSAPDFSNVRSAQANSSDLLAQSIEAFRKKEYAAVIQRLRSVSQTDPNYWPLSEVYAHACYLSGNTLQATRRFRQIAASGQLPFSERAEWYLLLCYLTRYPQDQSAFEALLSKILADPGHPYVEQARQLAKEVRG